MDKCCFDSLYKMCSRCSERQRPSDFHETPDLKLLPPPSYHGDKTYNGFTGAERRKAEQVQIYLRRKKYISKPTVCHLCGRTERIGFHGEDYFDPFSLMQVCFGCHMAIHRRFASPDAWLEKLEKHSDQPLIGDFQTLPLVPVDFATWLRENKSGPHDVFLRIWPDLNYHDHISKLAKNYVDAFMALRPSASQWALIECLEQNPGQTSAVLTDKMGWKGESAWHLQFGKFCRMLEPHLGDAPLTDERSDVSGDPAKFYSGILANYDPKTHGFTLKPQVSEAMAAARSKNRATLIMSRDRLDFPATGRNTEAIAGVLLPLLETFEGAVDLIEIASGSGQHAANIAPRVPDLSWWPTDIEPDHLRSIDAWSGHVTAANIKPATRVDTTSHEWINGAMIGDLSAKVRVIMCCNMIHIAPWAAAQGLIAGAGKRLVPGGILFLYGPYKRGGQHTAPSNEAFDESLRSRNPDWGVRDLNEVEALAERHELFMDQVVEMPANNLSVVFKRS